MPSKNPPDRQLITCEHVIRYQPQQHRPFKCSHLQDLIGVICADRHPLDVATVTFSGAVCSCDDHQASALALAKFAKKHEPVDQEVLFFYGLAGENAYLGHGGLDTTITGYNGQQKPNSGNCDIFEIEWEPTKTKVSTGTDNSIAKNVKYDNPAGFSGSLVWNTRFVEMGCDLEKWSPEEAKVTGLLRGWDTGTKTLLAWRVEHLHSWLSKRPCWA